MRRSLRRKWPVYILIGAACLSLGAAFFLPEVVPIGWHILHGKSARFHQWDIPVPWGWWAFREQGQVILQKMRRPVDRDSEVIFDEPLPADREPYDYDRQKYSLAEHMLKEGYRLTEERRTRLAGEDCFCLTFSDLQNSPQVRITCDVPNDRLAFYFAGDRSYIQVFESIVQHVTKKP